MDLMNLYKNSFKLNIELGWRDFNWRRRRNWTEQLTEGPSVEDVEEKMHANSFFGKQ